MARRLSGLSIYTSAFGVFVAVALHANAQDASICGAAPPVVEERLAGEIKGKAQLVTRFLGGAELSGRIESSRTEIFSKYPDAETSRWNAFFQFQTCVLIMSDQSKTSSQKLNELKEIQREFSKPLVKKVSIIIRSGQRFVDNRRFGPVDGSIGYLELRVNGKLITKASLDKPFGSHRVDLEVGDHHFEFRGKIYGAGGNSAILEDNCHGTFSVDGPGTFNPFVKFERRDLDGVFTDCALNPA